MEAKIVKFRTEKGIQVPAVSAEQMAKIDRVALAETGPSLLQMMENAGRSLAEVVMEILKGNWVQCPVAILAGPGGNGGGGVCAARHLANRNARPLLCLSQPDRLREATAAQVKTFRSAGGRLVRSGELAYVTPALILDALFGYGLRGAPRGKARELIRWANRNAAPVVSLDLPSGIDATTGRTPGEFIRPNWILTLALPKLGLAGCDCDELILADIGIPSAAFQSLGLNYQSPFGNCFRVRLFPSLGEG